MSENNFDQETHMDISSMWFRSAALNGKAIFMLIGFLLSSIPSFFGHDIWVAQGVVELILVSKIIGAIFIFGLGISLIAGCLSENMKFIRIPLMYHFKKNGKYFPFPLKGSFVISGLSLFLFGTFLGLCTIFQYFTEGHRVEWVNYMQIHYPAFQ